MGSPVELVRDLWKAHETSGLDAALRVAGDDVIWQPYLADGRVLRGSAELRDALVALAAQGIEYEAHLNGVEQHGNVVLANGTLRVRRSGAEEETDVYWAYHFHDGRLRRQTTYASREEALEALVALSALSVAPFGVVEEDGAAGERVVRLRGELDVATAPDLAGTLLKPRPAGERVVLDLGELRFMDSTGLSVLLRAEGAAREGNWQIVLRAVPPNIRRLFEIAGVADAVPAEAT
jgi:anti-sigma B factor antagonist